MGGFVYRYTFVRNGFCGVLIYRGRWGFYSDVYGLHFVRNGFYWVLIYVIRWGFYLGYITHLSETSNDVPENPLPAHDYLRGVKLFRPSMGFLTRACRSGEAPLVRIERGVRDMCLMELHLVHWRRARISLGIVVQDTRLQANRREGFLAAQKTLLIQPAYRRPLSI